jgi:hypothetical protein
MSPRRRNVDELIGRVRAQLKTRIVLRGLFVVLAVTLVSLIIVAALAGSFSPRPVVLLILRILPLVLTAGSAYLFIVRPLTRRVRDEQIALLIEEKCRLGNRLITAVEFEDNLREASPAIVDRLVKDVSKRSLSIDPQAVISPQRAYSYGTASVVILAVIFAMFFVAPGPLSDGMSSLYLPSGEVSANVMFINVAPGSARVPRGSDQKLKAALQGFEADDAQIFVRRLDSDRWLANPMEPAKNYGEFQFLIFNIQDSVSYYIESAGVRSPEFTLDVADLPFVKQLDLVLDYPEYTRLPNKKIEDGGEVAALKGTVVSVVAQLSATAGAARIVMSDGGKIEMTVGDENQFTGHFQVKQNGTYRIEITSESGERYNGSNEYDITVLDDHPPTVMVDKPGRDMKVTSIQEIFTQARAEDDYGVASIELYYSVNGGEEKRVQLQNLKNDSPKTLSGGHTFFLEEFDLKPGDFISYYAKARDNSGSGRESTSDIYFMEVRPFDRSFRQAQQMGGGGGGGEQDSNALTRRQREIIAATFRVQREMPDYTPKDVEENFDAITLSQEKLKADAEQLAERIRRRLGEQINSEPEYAKLVENLVQAAKEMTAATAELRARKTKEALPPEQRALQQLLRAEAIFRDIQVAQGGGGEGSGGGQQAQDLADLFELQLDKMKNQYETLQRQQQSAQDQQQDEIARRLQELARRQQQQLEQRMRQQQMQGGGGGGGGQRQQQEMIDEARRLARELEKLSRDRRDPKLEESARQLQQAADEMQRSQASSSSSANSAQASAEASRALQRLEQARRTLDQAGKSGNQQSVQRLRQKAEEVLKKQEEIAKGVDEIARSGQGGTPSQEKKQTVAEKKEALADQISGLERDIDQTARGMGQDKQQSADKLRDAAGAIRRNRIPDRIRQNNQFIESGWFEQAQDRERTIRGNIEEVVKNLQAAEGTSKTTQGESLEDALNRARELADNLESLRRRLESQQGDQNGQGQESSKQQGQQQGTQQAGQQQSGQQQGGRQPGGQQQGQQQAGQQQGGRQQSGRQQGGQQQGGQQAGQQQGGQQQGGQQQGGQQQGGQQQGGQQQGGQQQGGQQQGGQQQGGQQQGGRGQQPSESVGRMTNAEDTLRGGGPMRPGDRQLDSELRQRLAEAEELRRRLPRNSEMARDLGRIIDELRKFESKVFNDPNQLALLKSEIIDPLRQLELELARRLQAKLGNNGPGALSDGDAPDRYRKMIDDYYRRLSARSPNGKQ